MNFVDITANYYTYCACNKDLQGVITFAQDPFTNNNNVLVPRVRTGDSIGTSISTSAYSVSSATYTLGQFKFHLDFSFDFPLFSRSPVSGLDLHRVFRHFGGKGFFVPTGDLTNDQIKDLLYQGKFMENPNYVSLPDDYKFGSRFSTSSLPIFLFQTSQNTYNTRVKWGQRAIVTPTSVTIYPLSFSVDFSCSPLDYRSLGYLSSEFNLEIVDNVKRGGSGNYTCYFKPTCRVLSNISSTKFKSL